MKKLCLFREVNDAVQAKFWKKERYQAITGAKPLTFSNSSRTPCTSLIAVWADFYIF